MSIWEETPICFFIVQEVVLSSVYCAFQLSLELITISVSSHISFIYSNSAPQVLQENKQTVPSVEWNGLNADALLQAQVLLIKQ